MKWQYCYVALAAYGHFKARYEQLLERGKAGWELVTVDDGIAYFKRPVCELVIDIDKAKLEQQIEETVASLFKEAFEDDKEEKEAALKEEENKEDKGEPEGATFKCQWQGAGRCNCWTCDWHPGTFTACPS